MAREQRKLAAILAADVVGYSRLMGRDESARWRAWPPPSHRKLWPLWRAHGLTDAERRAAYRSTASEPVRKPRVYAVDLAAIIAAQAWRPRSPSST